MSLFDYTGQLATGSLFDGTIEAATQQSAELELAQMGIRVTELRAARRTAFVAPLSLADLTFFNDQLATLTKGGVPLDQGLRQLAADVGSAKLKRLLLDLAADLAAGTPLDQAIERQKQRFPVQYAGVVRAGLATGDLSGALYGLTAHLRLKSRFRRVLLELVAYPLVVLALALAVASFLMRQVIPILASTISDMHDDTGFAHGAIGPSKPFIVSLASAWPICESLIAAFVAVLLIVFLLTLLPGAHAWRERLLRRLPGFSHVYWSSVLARFTHTSAIAAYSGRPLPEMVAAGGQASGSPALAQAAQRVADRLVKGDALQAAADAERDLPALWTCAVRTAAPRGDLPAVLAELARTYELRAQQQVELLRALLGPLLFVVMAATIGSLVAVLMTAINTVIVVVQSVTG